MKRSSSQQGLSVIEVVIASAVITTGILVLITSYTIYFKYALANSGNVQAGYIAEEGLEGMSFIRDNGWTTYIKPLSTTTPYYLAFSNNLWKATTTVQYVDSHFLRKITITDAKRDAMGVLVSSGGTYDPDTKLITVAVDYYQGTGTTTKTISTYLTNINQD